MGEDAVPDGDDPDGDDFAGRHPWVAGAFGAGWIGIWGYLILHNVVGAAVGALCVGLVVALAWKQGSPLWRARRTLKQRHPKWFR